MSNRSYLRHKQLAKVPPHFYLKLVLLFLILVFVCSIGLFFEYQWLEYYENSQPASAANRYLTRLKERNYDEIYDEAALIKPIVNTKEQLHNYLYEKYDYMNVDELYISEDFGCSLNNPDLHCFNIRRNASDTIQTVYTFNVDDKWLALPQMVSNSYTIIVPDESLSLSLNGLTVTDDTNKNEDALFYQSFANLDNTSNLKAFPNYTVSEIIDNTPEFEVSNPNYLALQDPIQPYIYVGKKPDGENALKYEELIAETAKLYCQYITADISLWQLTSVLYPYSWFYDQVRTFENIWFTDHEKIEFKDINVSNIIELDDQGFMGNIEFDYIVTTNKGASKVYHTAYQITFIDSYGSYKASNIVTMANSNG